MARVASITRCKEQLEDMQMLKVIPGKSRILSACFLFLQPPHWSLSLLILFFIISHFSQLTVSAQMGVPKGGSPLYNSRPYSPPAPSGLPKIGGMTGLFLASLGVNVHVTDTYFIVAHFHYIMVGGAMFGYLGGLHY